MRRRTRSRIHSLRPGCTAGRFALTLVLVALLGAVFLRGFKEAIGIAVVLVGVYLLLNLVVVAVATAHVAEHATSSRTGGRALTAQHGNPAIMVGIALLVFPKLALGLSGFETGVAVMPQITGDAADTEQTRLAASAVPGVCSRRPHSS